MTMIRKKDGFRFRNASKTFGDRYPPEFNVWKSLMSAMLFRRWRHCLMGCCIWFSGGDWRRHSDNKSWNDSDWLRNI